MLGLLTYGLHGVVDAVFVGRLGTPQLAGLGFAVSFYLTVMVLFFGIMRNSVAFIARAFGAGQLREMGTILVHYQWLALAAMPLIWGLSLSFPLIVRWAGLSEEVGRYATIYVTIRVWESPFILLLFLYASYHQSKGNARLPMAVHWGVLGLNVVLDYGLIFGKLGLPEMGMAGSALATLIANASGAIFIVAVSHSSSAARTDRLRFLGWPRWTMMREILIVSVPLGIGDFIEVSGFMGFLMIVGWLGDSALAANNIVMQLTHVLALPGFAVGIAASTYMGRFLGAGAPDVARSAVLRTLLMGTIYMGTLGMPLWFLGEFIAAAFTTDPEVIALAGLIFKVVAVYQVLDAVGMVLRSALSGAGDTYIPTLMLLGSILLVLLTGAWLLSRTVDPGIVGAWLAAFGHMIVVASVMSLRFRGGRWREMRLQSV